MAFSSQFLEHRGIAAAALRNASAERRLAQVRNRMGYPFPFTPAVNRLFFPNGGVYSAAAPAITYRSSHVVLKRGSIWRALFINKSYNGGATNDFTLGAAVQLGASQAANLTALQKIPLKFDRAATATLPAGGAWLSDPWWMPAEVGDVMFFRTFCSSAAANDNWPVGPRLDRFQEGSVVGDQTLTDAAFAAAGPSFAPSIIGCQSEDGEWIYFSGDSIGKGDGDDLNDRGFVDRWQLATGIPVVRATVTGETLALGADRLAIRWESAAGATHAISEGAGNDIHGGALLAAVQASAIRHWRDLSGLGQEVAQCTILPRPGSANNWLDALLQSPWLGDAAKEAVRVAFNAWLRAGAPVTASGATYVPAAIGAGIPCPYLSRVLDICAPVEVDAANVLTQDGGRLLVGATLRTANATGGTTQSLVDAAANFTAIPVAGCLVEITAGTGVGQVNWVVGAASPTQINLLNVWPVAPNATSVYRLVPVPTKDGPHLAPTLQQIIADWLTANY